MNNQFDLVGQVDLIPVPFLLFPNVYLNKEKDFIYCKSRHLVKSIQIVCNSIGNKKKQKSTLRCS